ncbi:GAF domain-containing protein [Marmoricola sp. RAF53]|uniref:GAF domain-containing protein n=1 Tax=Marmoricola sp. RAF53 TaxID=3233059 RepID=UPI003F9B7BCE
MSAGNGLARSVAAVRELFDAAACSCALADEDGGALTFAAADGIGAAEVVGVQVPVGRGLVGWTAMSGQPVAVRDVRADTRFAQDIAEGTGYVPTTILAAPFFDGAGEVVGVLEVLDPGIELVGDWPLAVLGTLASQLAAVVAGNGASSSDERYAALGRRVAELVENQRA